MELRLGAHERDISNFQIWVQSDRDWADCDILSEAQSDLNEIVYLFL